MDSDFKQIIKFLEDYNGTENPQAAFKTARSLSRANPKLKCIYYYARSLLNKSKKRNVTKYNKKAFKNCDILILKSIFEGLSYQYSDKAKAEQILKDARGACDKYRILIEICDNALLTIVDDYKPPKIEIMWEDLCLTFLTETELNLFKDNKKTADNSFMGILKNFIIAFNCENIKVINLLKNNGSYLNLREKFKKVVKVLQDLKEHLKDNFVKSQRVEEIYLDYEGCYQFFVKVTAFEKGELESNAEFVHFEVPVTFGFAAEVFENARKVVVDKSVYKKKIMDELMEYFNVEGPTVNVPFGPIFYDLAYEYIEYPKEEGNVFKRFFFGSKK